MTEGVSRRGAGSPRAVLSGASIVLADRVLEKGSLVLDDGRIAEIADRALPVARGGLDVDCSGLTVVPGFIDVHVHGVEGADALDGGGAIAEIASRLPRFGVTAFCPTSIACTPDALSAMLRGIRASRASSSGARVLPAHLESNFINPDYRGAQPLACIRSPRHARSEDGTFTGRDILDVVAASRAEVGIMTIAPELDEAIPLIRDLVARGIIVSLGHSGATYEQAQDGIEAGARHATHLFNRMTPLGHRAPGLAAAVLESGEIATELICDGVHVHPAMIRLAFAAKGPHGVMAITDGTAGSGLAPGALTTLGGRRITVRDAAYLDDGTLAGSVLTMDRAFRRLVTDIGLGLPVAALACATTPARSMALAEVGEIAQGYTADLVVLDQSLEVAATYVGGALAWSRS
jgi:N-acetylglucosamine-6-phosphate deacetylase